MADKEAVPRATETIIHDASTLWKGMLSMRAFLYDMRCRERTWAHEGTLFLGILEIVAAITFCIALHVHHATMENDYITCMNQLTVVLGVAGFSQGFLTMNGICMENAAMLIVANLNGFYILGYLTMHLGHVMINHSVDIAVVAVFGVFSLLHLVFSALAWGGELHRFIFFRVGGDEQTVRRYRCYELLVAALLIDLVVTITTCTNLFFMIDGKWWEYLLLGVIIVSAALAQAAVRTAVRYERTALAIAALGSQTIVTGVCAVALWYNKFMGVSIPQSCNEAPIVMFGLMAGTHTFSIIVFLCCATFFGEGMKEVFAHERAAVEFVNANYDRHKELAATFLN